MRQCQIEAITSLEKSFAADHPRALIQMATGAGKTYTACAFTYRLIRHAGARRVLFLRRPRQSRPPGQGRVRPVRHPRHRPQVHRALQRPASHLQLARHRRPRHHLHHPAPLFDSPRRGRIRRGPRREIHRRAQRRLGKWKRRPAACFESRAKAPGRRSSARSSVAATTSPKKITYQSKHAETGKPAKCEQLIAEFRTSPSLRIAVTVDMIATGTDIKPLECLLFLRDVRSRVYFEQMKGRGTRVLTSTDLQAVSGADARAKTHFVIVDAVGVCESDKTESRPLERQPTINFPQLLLGVALDKRDEDTLTTLAGRLARLERELNHRDTEALRKLSGGETLGDLAKISSTRSTPIS